MVQKQVPYKEDFLLCEDNVVVMDNETGEIICQKCGKVLREKIDEKKKERLFFDEEDNSRVGPQTSITVYDMGLSTVVGNSNSDFVGRKLSFEMKQSMKRMRLWDSRSKAKSSTKNLRFALYEMYKLKDKLGLSNTVVERSAYFYRKATKADLVRGRTVKSVIGACLYAACRDLDTSRTLVEISNHLQEKPNRIAKTYRLLLYDLNLTVPYLDTKNIIIKLANNLKMSEPAKRKAISIFDSLQEKELTAGKNPHAVAATMIYMSGLISNEHITQDEIAKFSGVTSVTIRNRLQDYKKHVRLV